MPEEGFLIIISGPSGAGKGTVTKTLYKLCGNLCYSVSATTRTPRPGEADGKDYFFLTKEEFICRKDKGEFLEWAEVYGNYYGTPRDFVSKKRAAGKHVILEIDTVGAEQVRRQAADGIFIFLLPPSMDELRHRIKGRGTEDPLTMERRLSAAYKEVKLMVNYDYVILNDDVNAAAAQINSIVNAESCRVERNKHLLEIIQGSDY